jgi:hypothetical protein
LHVIRITLSFSYLGVLCVTGGRCGKPLRVYVKFFVRQQLIEEADQKALVFQLDYSKAEQVEQLFKD